MNEAEKLAIQELKVLVGLAEYNKLSYKENLSINIALKLIDKQQKEIEELKEVDFTTAYMQGFYDGKNRFKDKIKEKIEDLKQYKEEIKDEKDFEYFTTLRIIKTLKSLLGE